jgi:hypothetical protein
MVIRKLLKYWWVYDKEIISLVDKKSGYSFNLPISYLDSFLRASIAFKAVHKREQLKRNQDRNMKWLKAKNELIKKLKMKLKPTQPKLI